MKLSRSMPGLEAAPAFLSDLIDTLTERGRSLLGRRQGARSSPRTPSRPWASFCSRAAAKPRAWPSRKRCLPAYAAAEPAERLAFLQALADRFGPDRQRVERAIEAVREDAGTDALEGLHAAAEPRRQELIRRLNLAPGGTAALVRMREELLEHLRRTPGAEVRRRRLHSSVLVLVQPRVSGAAADRLDDACQYSGEDHPLRGRPRDPELGRPAQPPRSRRTAAATAFSIRSSSTSR